MSLDEPRKDLQRGNGTKSRSISPIKDFRRSMTLPTSPAIGRPLTSSFPRGASPSEESPNSEEPDILTALAAQERLVLELKETLLRAEEDLVKLRKQWASHESRRRTNDRHRITQMKPINTSLATKTLDNIDDPNGSSAWMYDEMERRKALLGNAKSPHRRVFSGSRETKTLSLVTSLEPTIPSTSSILTLDSNSNVSASPRTRHPREPVKTLPVSARPRVSPHKPWHGTEFPPSPDRTASRSPQREAIIQTGKQMATDFRDGLWTFLEDLRQVAVGEDARASATASISSRHGSPAHIDARRTSPDRKSHIRRGRVIGNGSPRVPAVVEKDPLLEEVHGDSSPIIIATPATPRKHAKRRSTQVGNFSSSPAVEVDGMPSEARESPRTSSTDGTPNSMNDIAQDGLHLRKARDVIPWPELTRLAPGNFKRTASELMAELERSLTPSPSAHGEGDDEEFYNGMAHDGLMH